MKLKRIGGLDTVRAIAVFCVVLNHVTETVYDYSLEEILNLSEADCIFAFSGFTLGRIGCATFFTFDRISHAVKRV